MTMAAKGVLIPIGGNEDKGAGEIGVDEDLRGLDFIEEGILSHVVRESGGVDAKIIVIPTASSIPKEVGANYLDAFEKLGCTQVSVMKLTKPKQCSKKKNLKLIAEADCVMFSGGDQSKITAVIAGTPLHGLLVERFVNERFVIAGTSAGAMAMATEMIAGGSSREALLKGAVTMRKGLNLIPDLIIDTHFIKRGRFGRLAEAVAIHPGLIGIGLAEDTGLIITNRDSFRVIGSGMVIVLDASHLTHNAHKQLKPGTPMSMSNLITHILVNGDELTINGRSISILPINEKFL